METATIGISAKGIERITIRRQGGRRCVEALRDLLTDLEDLDFLMRMRAAAPQLRKARHHEEGQ